MSEINQKRLELKQKLQKRQRVFAAWTSLAHPSITEMFCRTGVDFVGIDIEHSTISQEQSQRIIAACQAHQTLCLPRIATHNMEMIKRLLDSGADGLIVPMVETPRQIEDIIAWSKYSPQGQRGFGVARAQGYGFDFFEYSRQWNKVSSLIIQIESITAVDNIEALLSYESVDAVMVGPYDISASLGIPGEITHPRVIEASKRVIAACRSRGKSCGTQIIEPDGKTIEDAFALGYTFIVLSSDIFLLWKWSERMQGVLKEIKS